MVRLMLLFLASSKSAACTYSFRPKESWEPNGETGQHFLKWHTSWVALVVTRMSSLGGNLPKRTLAV